MDKEAQDALDRIGRELASIRKLVVEVVNYMREAESEVPEKMRRFIMYMHDIHDVKHLYEELGLCVPTHIMREAERCDDRLRQLLTELHTDGGAFEKVRREMAKDADNRWDHTRQLAAPKGNPNETRTSSVEQNGLDQSGTEEQGD